MNEPILRLEGVTREFPGFLLDRVSFSLEPGYVMGLLGPNGAGKTTTIKLILGLLRPREGTIRVFGLESGAAAMAIKRQVGYLAEKVTLPEIATPGWVGGFLSRCFPTWDGKLYERYLKRFGVPAGKTVRSLSKGNRTKLALAAAMAHRPRLLILDEPTSGLDPLVRHEVIDALRDVVAEEDRSVLFSTHIVSDLEAIADFVTVIDGGRVIASEARDRLTERWRAAYEDDKADLWVLLKVLPISPARVVGARYLAGALVTGAFGLAVAAPLAWLTPAGTGWQGAVGAGLGAGLVLGALFNAIYYRSGYRTVSTWFRFILLLFVVPFLLVGRLRETALVQAVIRAMTWLEANPGTGAAVAAAAILVLYLASWVCAAAAFSRKELT